MEEKEYWIWFARILELGPVRKNKLLLKYKTPKEIYKLTEEELLQVEGIGKNIAKRNFKKRV